MPERPWWKTLPSVFTIFLVTLLVVAYLFPFLDMDYGILVRRGEQIVRTGDLQPPENFSYTIAGTAIPDFEWPFEVVVWAIWEAFGYGGLKLLKVLLIGATLLILGLRLRSQGVRWHGIALTLALACALLAGGWNLRPLYFTSIGLLMVSGWLHDHCTGRRPLTWWLPVVMLLWANLHPGVITGQGLLAGAIAWEWINRKVRLNPPLDLPALRRLTLIGGLGLAATFVGPHPVERILAPFRPEVRHPIQRIILEMQPLYSTIEGLPVYLLAGLIGLTVVLRFRRFRLWEVGLLCGLGVLASMALRSSQDWVLILLSQGVPHLTALLREGARAYRRRQPMTLLLRLDRSCKRVLNSKAFRFQWEWSLLALLLLAAVSLVPPLSRRMPVQESGDYPTRAVNWIEAQGRPSSDAPWRVFGLPDYGAYLVWRLGDRVRCYADTRTFCYPPRLIEDSFYIPLKLGDWRARLEQVLDSGTDYFLLAVAPVEERGQLWNTLRPWIPDPLYQDEEAVLVTSADVRHALRRLDEKEAAARAEEGPGQLKLRPRAFLLTSVP
jgi:hypothetical protein